MAGSITHETPKPTVKFVDTPTYGKNGQQRASLVLPTGIVSPKKEPNSSPVPVKQPAAKKPEVISWEKPTYDKNTETPADYFLKLVKIFTEYSHRLYGEGNCSSEYFQWQYNDFYKDCLALIDDESPTAKTSLQALHKAALKCKVNFNEFSVNAVKTKLKDIESEQQSIKAQPQSIPVTPKQSSTPEAPKTDLKTKVIQALDTQITRLEEKLTGCFSLFTINVELIEKKIEILKQMKTDVHNAKTEDQTAIKRVLYEITNDNKFLPTNGTYVARYDTEKLKHHRIGFIGNAATHDHLAEAFKNLTPKPK